LNGSVGLIFSAKIGAAGVALGSGGGTLAGFARTGKGGGTLVVFAFARTGKGGGKLLATRGVAALLGATP
jgi:hypothetical protein